MKRYLFLFSMLCFLFVLSAQTEYPKDKVWDIAVSQKYVYFGYSNGVGTIQNTLAGALRQYNREDQTWRTFTMTDIFGSEIEAGVNAVATDGENMIWVGVRPMSGHSIAYGCAFSLDNGEHWTCLSVNEGLAANAVLDIAIDPVTGDIWLGYVMNTTNTSLSRSSDQGATWSHMNVNDRYGIARILPYNGKVWAAAFYGNGKPLLYSPDNGVSWQNMYNKTPALGQYCDVSDMKRVSENEIHCATYTDFATNSASGGYCYTTDNGNSWTTKKVNSYQEYSSCIAVDPDGVWLGRRLLPDTDTDYIVFSSDRGANWTRFPKKSFPYDDPYAICYDPYADITWFGFWSDLLQNYQSGWAWTDNQGATWHTDNPPALSFSAISHNSWMIY